MSYSLVERTGDSASFSVHPLIHLWAQERLATSQRQTYVLKAIHIMGSALREFGSFSNESYSWRRGISPHLQTLNSQAKELLFEVPCNLSIKDAEHFSYIGSEFLWNRKLNDAFRWLSRALNSCKESDGSSHATTLMIVAKLGNVHEKQGESALALAHYERAYIGRRDIYGGEHESTLILLRRIGRVYSQMNEVQKSLETLQQVLVVQKRVLGDLHPDTLDSYCTLGAYFARYKQPDKALEMSMLGLTGREKVYGEDHTLTLKAACLMGYVYFKMGNYGESMKYYKRDLAGQERRFGTDHAEWLYAAFCIGAVHQSCSEHDAALEWYSKVLAGREVLAGKDHPSVMKVVETMAVVRRRKVHLERTIPCRFKPRDR